MIIFNNDLHLPVLFLRILILQIPLPTLTPGTIMHDLVRENIAIDTEEALTALTLIAPGFGNSVFAGFEWFFRSTGFATSSFERHPIMVLSTGRTRTSIDSSWPLRKRCLAPKTMVLSRRARFDPIDLSPVVQWEQMMMVTCQVGAEDECEPAGWTLRG